MPQFPSYDIAQPETIVMRIPASAMRNNVEDIPAAAKFVIGASRGIAILKSPPPTANLGSMLGASVGGAFGDADGASGSCRVGSRLGTST